MKTCYGCPQLISQTDAAGFREYKCADSPGIIKAEQDIYNYDDPIPFDDCEWGKESEGEVVEGKERGKMAEIIAT